MGKQKWSISIGGYSLDKHLGFWFVVHCLTWFYILSEKGAMFYFSLLILYTEFLLLEHMWWPDARASVNGVWYWQIDFLDFSCYWSTNATNN